MPGLKLYFHINRNWHLLLKFNSPTPFSCTAVPVSFLEPLNHVTVFEIQTLLFICVEGQVIHSRVAIQGLTQGDVCHYTT